ncbi:MAG TPA: hypothetical protein VFH94_00745 [Streptomyces sp.]|nr:hypothetical protein [Streptomyces sp.]
MFNSTVRRVRVSRRPVLRAATGLLVAALLTAGALSAAFVWNGSPYPAADPDLVAQRLKNRSEDVRDHFALPGTYRVDSGVVATGSCYYRGLRSIAHIDSARPDVRSFGLDWSIPDVPEATARAAQLRVRRQLAERGWKLTHEGDRSDATFRALGFRFADPRSGDQVDVDWNDSTTTLFISVYAECGKVPDGFKDTAHDWPESVWHPKGQGARLPRS